MFLTFVSFVLLFIILPEHSQFTVAVFVHQQSLLTSAPSVDIIQYEFDIGGNVSLDVEYLAFDGHGSTRIYFVMCEHSVLETWWEANRDELTQCKNLAVLSRCTSLVGQTPHTTAQRYTLNHTFASKGFYHILLFNCQRLYLTLNYSLRAVNPNTHLSMRDIPVPFVAASFCLAWFLFLVLRLCAVPSAIVTLSRDLREAGRLFSALVVSLYGQRQVTKAQQSPPSLRMPAAYVPQPYVGWLTLHASSMVIYFLSSSIMWLTVHWTGVGRPSAVILVVLYAVTRLTFALSLFVVSSGLAFTRLNPTSQRSQSHHSLTRSERRSIFLLTLTFAAVNSFHYLLHTATTFYVALLLDIVFYKAQFAHILHNTTSLRAQEKLLHHIYRHMRGQSHNAADSLRDDGEEENEVEREEDRSEMFLLAPDVVLLNRAAATPSPSAVASLPRSLVDTHLSKAFARLKYWQTLLVAFLFVRALTVVTAAFFLRYYWWLEQSLYALWDFFLIIGIAILFKPHQPEETRRKPSLVQGWRDERETGDGVEMQEFVSTSKGKHPSDSDVSSPTASSAVPSAPAMLILHTPGTSNAGRHPQPIFALAWREHTLFAK